LRVEFLFYIQILVGIIIAIHKYRSNIILVKLFIIIWGSPSNDRSDWFIMLFKLERVGEILRLIDTTYEPDVNNLLVLRGPAGEIRCTLVETSVGIYGGQAELFEQLSVCKNSYHNLASCAIVISMTMKDGDTVGGPYPYTNWSVSKDGNVVTVLRNEKPWNIITIGDDTVETESLDLLF
jgi:hypothetical protein